MHFANLTGCVACLLPITSCFAGDGMRLDADHSGNILMIQAAPGMVHFHSNPQHVRYSWLVGAEWQHHSRWLGGYSYFNNSFGQKSHYLYAGHWWPISGNDPTWYVKLTGGALAGYKKPFDNKIPYNHNGIAPGIVWGLGYKMNRFNLQLNMLGTAGFMVTAGYDLVR